MVCPGACYHSLEPSRPSFFGTARFEAMLPSNCSRPPTRIQEVHSVLCLSVEYAPVRDQPELRQNCREALGLGGGASGLLLPPSAGIWEGRGRGRRGGVTSLCDTTF